LAASNAARAHLHGLMVGMSNEYAKFNITFNTVCPGIILTDRQIGLAQYDADKENVDYETVLEKKAQSIPSKRIGKPEELASLVGFLASEQASYITAQKIAVDGGMTGVF